MENTLSFNERATHFKSLREIGYNKRYLRSIKNKTLQELKQKRQLKVGSIKPCRGKLCQICNFIQKTTQIKKGNETVKIFQNLNCNSRNLIYLIHCDSCGAQYVETGRTLREGFNGHRADARLSKRTNVAIRFDGCLCNFEQHCKLYPIEEIPDTLSQEANKKLRLERENFWIRKLKTYTPYGMNSGANANSESIMPLTIKFSSTAKVASHKIRSLFTQLKALLDTSS